LGYIVATYCHVSTLEPGAPVSNLLGRPMYPVPLLLRSYVGDYLWEGWGWFTIDTIGFWIGVAILGALFDYAGKLQARASQGETGE
jgi:hypothetical protein